MKKILIILNVLIICSSVLLAREEDKAMAKLKELFPDHGSVSHSLYTDFYEMSFYDMKKGGMVYGLIDVDGNAIATSSDDDKVKFDEKIVVNVKEDCKGRIIKKGKTPSGDEVFIVTCFKENGLNAIYILDQKYKVIRKGQRK